MAGPFVQANTGGRLHPADEPSLPPLNRGFLYGDAIYEVWRTYAGVVFAWEEHWGRLRASAEALHFPLPFAPARILEEIRRTAAAHRAASGYAGDLYIRLQITRGAGPIGLDIALAEEPVFVILVQPCPEMTPARARAGLTLSVCQGLRRNPAAALDPAWKTGNYLNNLLGLREARARGADEVVMLNLAGEVTEAAVSNLAFVRDGVLITPPLRSGLLAGITRGLVLGPVGAAAGVKMAEVAIRPEDFPRCAECFLLSTTKDIVPVSAIDARRFEVGPQTVAARLKAAFAEYARNYVALHPEWKVI